MVVEIVDDEGTPQGAAEAAHRFGPRVDLLLGPYSTVLANAAARAIEEDGGLLWNHGGSGSHVERGYPGHVVSILTPTRRYADPFLAWLEAVSSATELWIAAGAGRFARQVAGGAAAGCARAGIEHRRVASAELIRGPAVSGPWNLFSAGSFEEDVELANWATRSGLPPRVMCAVGAGVHRFRDAAGRHDGVLGVAQWAAGRRAAAAEGPAEAHFLQAYLDRWHQPLDYPGIQAVAGAVIAVHCARTAGQTGRQALWCAAAELRTSTLFGDFEIDPSTGEQVGHRVVLVHWDGDRLALV